MLRVNQLSGFGGAGLSAFTFASASDSNTNNPSFSFDLGPAGTKTVICVFACSDSNGSDPWDWGTGSVGGEAFTYVIPGGEENAGNGALFTGGVTIRALQTSLGGVQTVTIPIQNYVGPMNTHQAMLVVARGVSATPISVDNGDNFTISTVGARLVVGGCVNGTAPGNMTGPGTEVTLVATSQISIGYDLAPAGGASDVYSFSGTKYVIAGASFG
jgi:hypothetical protein